MQNKHNFVPKDADMGENKENNTTSQKQWLPISMCLGFSIGMSLGGLIFDNMSIGMCFGISLGVAVGSILDAKNRVDTKTGQPSPNTSCAEETNRY